jgi:hydroxymethylpyrimidine pyrophosphatase-like HAD family hydrolase
VLVYVTGRSVPATLELMEERDLPRPDLLIADVGTTVRSAPDLAPVEEIEAEIEACWPGRAAVRERLNGVPGLELQAVDAPRRVSYWVREGTVSEALDRAAERLEGLAVDLVGSAGVYLDVLPRGVNKGSTLRRVLRWLERSETDVVVAGDSLNDLALFDTGMRGVVVGNCEAELRSRVQGREHLYLARGEGAAGILEGLRQLGWIGRGGDHGQ